MKIIINLKALLISYLNTSLNFSKNIILLTHLHKKHFEGSYPNDINAVIKKILYEEKITKYVKVVDLSENLFNVNPNKATLDEVFPGHQEDVASHPHFEYYQNILTEKIYNLAD